MYQIQTPSRKCARTGRDLTPGEQFYSVVYDRQGQWIREDISRDAWTGVPPEAFSYWLTRIPTEGQPKKPIIDDEMLWNCFQRLPETNEPKQTGFRYVLTLLLMRHKRLRFVDVKKENDREWLVVRDPKQKTTYSVMDPHLTEERLVELQEELENLLGMA